MRIPVKVEYFAGGLRPIVSFFLKSDGLNIRGIVKAIVDTGSPKTILSQVDTERLRISQIQIRKLTGKKEEVNLGGAQMKTQTLEDANIKIGSYIDTTFPIQVPVEVTKGISSISILGVDFLISANLKFFFDPVGKNSWLETVE